MTKISLTGTGPKPVITDPPVPDLSRQNPSIWRIIRKWMILVFTSLGIIYTGLVGVYICSESYAADQIWICFILTVQALACIICQAYGFTGALTGSRLCTGIYWIYTIIDAGQQTLAVIFSILYPVQIELLAPSCAEDSSNCRILMDQDSSQGILSGILLGQTVVSSVWALIVGTLFYDLSQAAKVKTGPGAAQIV